MEDKEIILPLRNIQQKELFNKREIFFFYWGNQIRDNKNREVKK